MPETPLHSIAAIAKSLDVPESTLHYWKNRFGDFLPGRGQGRGRRFEPEALDVFRAIAELLGSGLAVPEVRDELARRFAATDSPDRQAQAVIVRPAPVQQPDVEQLALRIGTAMAEAMGQRLSAWLGAQGVPAATAPALEDPAARTLRDDLEEARREIVTLRAENENHAAKFKVLEAELVRLRKDSRQMEKHLLEKIKGVKV
ncbi:hypothetical protein NNJEOMEG_01454 [Fundidesulfovibrio magnetotacticus]|uniref:HTH merR-type domain-containing protein n=1 Tax=Fundidesulfovibrio magnetotacticus TaxID=2730080 RepID=A0A6V8LRL7_9BACT|nr:MerR family transcriptional regulator [Fundidesulfovibrio magnetotacticus]GFK93620.1 hypothetical protein NNJEOMEG_01454 [Fundidesulfovibrio magnetotacticus]